MEKEIRKLNAEIENIEHLQHCLKLNLIYLDDLKREKKIELLKYINTENLLNELNDLEKNRRK